ncbi:MAG: two-component system response regulator CreB [Gammaproteobacteria bacterium RIFOXYA12_FULL_61_12]|nr:MAG: two-component system response regulator CreB [Gammaproteobacteria bacterium RIFOXYA12_FULL_61_12]OGT88321.1 MAG: two-component system response regulator CreB [Gammaproteobacteria bacterium RIFOXYD12_FULL_61_37]
MPRILLIEDEAAIADTVVYALETEGFRVTWKTLGREGLALLREGGLDLAVLDVGLPDGNGFELCKQIRTFSQIPIIFLTARSEEIDRIVGLEIGADDYVTKPFSPRELAARVKAILKRSGGVAAPVVGGFEIDRERSLIRYQGQRLDLTRYEYLILALLLGRPERIFSREEIMDRVWSDPAESFDRAVDTHIKTLRAKLRAIREDEEPIRTHRGMGYSFSGAVSEA